MKKYWKLSTIILASSMLLSGGYYLLVNRNTTQANNQTLLNYFSNDQQSDNVQIVDSVNDIKFVANSNSASMFALVKGKTIEEADKLYAWGNNTSGQLGVNSISNRSTPTLVELPEKAKISYVLSGHEFTLLLLENNSIWGAGNNRYGQLGNGEFSAPMTYITIFREMTNFFVGKNITSISAGYDHCVVVVDNSELYTWGRNDVGQLGNGSNGDSTNVNVPTIITEAVDGLISKIGKITEVYCGYGTTFMKVLKNNENTLYCWGRGTSGQLGLGNTDNILQPKLLDNLLIKGFTNIYVSLENVFTYNDITGELYGWGRNESNQLGLNDVDPKIAPIKISLLFSEKITKIFGSANSTKILTESGKVYTTGSGTNGAEQNGLGVEASTFTQISSIPVVTNIIGCFNTTIAFISD